MVLKGPPGDLLLTNYTTRNVGWDATVELRCGSSPKPNGSRNLRILPCKRRILPLGLRIAKLSPILSGVKAMLCRLGYWQISVAFGLQILGFLSVEKCNVNP